MGVCWNRAVPMNGRSDRTGICTGRNGWMVGGVATLGKDRR